MRIITDLTEANNLLKSLTDFNAQIWMFHISHKKIAIRFSTKKVEELVVYLVVVSCDYMTGPFSWNKANIFISKKLDENSELRYKIVDKDSKFELISSGGFSIAQGLESEFGKSFDDFLIKD